MKPARKAETRLDVYAPERRNVNKILIFSKHFVFRAGVWQFWLEFIQQKRYHKHIHRNF